MTNIIKMHDFWMMPSAAYCASNTNFIVGFHVIGLLFCWFWQLAYLMSRERRSHCYNFFFICHFHSPIVVVRLAVASTLNYRRARSFESPVYLIKPEPALIAISRA